MLSLSSSIPTLDCRFYPDGIPGPAPFVYAMARAIVQPSLRWDLAESSTVVVFFFSFWWDMDYHTNENGLRP